MKRFTVLMVVFTGLFLTACTQDFWTQNVTMATQTFVSYDVEFNARAGGNAGPLEIHSGNRNCKKPAGKSRKGCVAFEHGSFGVLKFALRNEGGNNSEACGDSGVQWVITKVEASVTPDPADDNKGKAGSFDDDLPDWVDKAFFPIENSSTGDLYESDLDNATTSVVIMNRNNNLDPQVLWYQVTASRCGTDNPVVTKTTDPRVENKGLN